MFNKKRNETNYWMSYADILTGLVIVLIIILIVQSGNLTECQGDLGDCNKKYSADSAQVAILKILDATFKEFEKESDLFKFDNDNNQFKLDIDMMFLPKATEIPNGNLLDLKSAGDDLYTFLNKLNAIVPQVRFNIVLEGRSAKFLNKGDSNEFYNNKYAIENKVRSFNRALNLENLFKSETNLYSLNFCDIVTAGSGFDGVGRYPYKPRLEEKNKNFVVKIIPIFKPVD